MAAPLGLAASASADQFAVPAADAVASGRLWGSGGGEGGWAARGASAWTVSGASASGTGDAGGAAITAPTNVTSSTVMNTKRTNRAAFVRAAWVMAASAVRLAPARSPAVPGPAGGNQARHTAG